MSSVATSIKKFIQKNFWVGLILLVFLLFFYLLYWNSFSAPWEGDEGEYAYSAWLMRQGETPYLNSFLQKPPLVIYTYYLAHWLKPFALWPPRLIAFLFTLASCFLLALIAKKTYGVKAAWTALWIAAPLLSLSTIDALPANTEKFMMLPLVGLIALFVFKKGQETHWTYLAAGILGALAILYKPIALPPVFVLLIYWLVANWLKNRNGRQFLKTGGLVLGGGLLAVGSSLFYFFINGALGEIWQQVFVFNLNYAAASEKYFPTFFFKNIYIFLFNFWPLGLLAAGSFFYRPPRIFLWWSLLVVALLPIMTTSIGHYYLLLSPFMVLIVAGTVERILTGIKTSEETWKNIILVGLIACIWGVFFCSIGEQFFLKPLELSKWVYRTSNLPEAMLVAEKVKQYSQPGDRIFIAGSEPQIYYFSERRSVSRFDMTYPFSIDTPWSESYQRQAIAELERDKPQLIVFPLGVSGLWSEETPKLFIDYIIKEISTSSKYRLLGGTVSDYRVSTYLGPAWVGPEQITSSSILLYIKND